ncbi:hypothetical protein ZIOFF_033475 [Zingiber officinale]|uniref:PWWP domain-containing protein n=1 Tax=Zingiber officinale TaxID=94328 RepID=A0A8J5LC92_ZINOF|nr:hypothetical protein ZIOFF_033475 [Zingiber officinale]
MESLKPQAEDPPPAAKLPDPPPLSRSARRASDPAVSPFLPGREEPERGAFRVGDLVWGKLKVRTWWPGEVLDPSTEIAPETKMLVDGNSVLVSFFGDAEIVARFEVSKVIPFEEDLPRMLRQSASPRFVRAVKDALAETENRLMSEFLCGSSTDSNLEGVGKCSISNYSPEQFCDRLLDAAKDASGVGWLEGVLLRSWALALRRQVQSPADLLESESPLLDTAAIDELEVEGKVGYSRVAKGPQIAEASNHKNKERSIAELIAGNDLEVAQPPENMVKNSTLHILSAPQSPESPIPKKKGGRRTTFGVKNAVELDKPNSPSLSSEEQTRTGGTVFERERRSSGREHKRSKYLSPPYANEIGHTRRSVTEGSESPESSFIKSFSQVSKKEDEIHIVSNGNQNSTVAILTVLHSVAANPLSPKLIRSTIAVSDLFKKFRSSFCLGNTNLFDYQKFMNELGRMDEQFAENSKDSNTTKEISMLKRTKKVNLVSNEAPIDKGIEVCVPSEPGKVQKRRKMKHGEAGSETTFVQENSNANGTKRVDLSQEKEMVKSSVDSQIDLNSNAKDATDVRTPPTAVTGIVDHSEHNKLGRKRKTQGTMLETESKYACQPGTISSQIKTSSASNSPLPYVRKSLERMISKLTGFVKAETEVGSSNALKPEIVDNLVGDMDGLLKKVNMLLTGPPGNRGCRKSSFAMMVFSGLLVVTKFLSAIVLYNGLFIYVALAMEY